MSSRLVLALGIVFLLFGSLYPLGVMTADLVKYALYMGIILTAIGILALPGKSDA